MARGTETFTSQNAELMRIYQKGLLSDDEHVALLGAMICTKLDTNELLNSGTRAFNADLFQHLFWKGLSQLT